MYNIRNSSVADSTARWQLTNILWHFTVTIKPQYDFHIFMALNKTQICFE